uniref:Uncharacterized protein n=1 Tax=Rhizophora mucronata TaxID=61149 RepID=A0A2P2Q4B9_RHIMU
MYISVSWFYSLFFSFQYVSVCLNWLLDFGSFLFVCSPVHYIQYS